MSPIPTLGSLDTRYAVLYTPALIFGYLSLTVETIDLVFYQSNTIGFFGFSLSATVFYQLFTLLCIIGASFSHQILLLIFGHGGPEKNPKNSDVALKHMITYLTYIDIRDVETVSLLNLADILGQKARLRNVWRFFYVGIPIGVLFISTYLSPLLLFTGLQSLESPSVIGIGLLIIQTIFIVQTVVWTDKLILVPPESAEFVDTPEYIRGEEALEKVDESTIQRKLDEIGEYD